MKKNRIRFPLLLVLTAVMFVIPQKVYAEEAYTVSADKEGWKTDETVSVKISGNGLEDVYGFEIVLAYDEEKLEYVSATAGQSVGMGSAYEEEGLVHYAYTMTGEDAEGVSGSQLLCSMTFRTIATGDAKLQIQEIKTIDTSYRRQVYEAENLEGGSYTLVISGQQTSPSVEPSESPKPTEPSESPKPTEPTESSKPTEPTESPKPTASTDTPDSGGSGNGTDSAPDASGDSVISPRTEDRSVEEDAGWTGIGGWILFALAVSALATAIISYAKYIRKRKEQ